ncbi:MAG TPA: hypothetical protein VF060_24655 [Trebonia sp.]
MNWYLSLPAAESSVPCGGGTHTVRWEAGRLTLPAHPDAEAELVLGALGGDKPACVSLAETWDRHARDLAVLMAGPRSAADRVTVTWEQVAQQRTHWFGMSGPATGHGRGAVFSAAVRVARRPPASGAPPGWSATAPMAVRGGEEFARRVKQRFELLELLALGSEFQFRLSGAVAAAWAADERAGERAERRSELTAALTGRFAPVAAEWLGIDPDAVTITPHEGPGWGTLSVTGTGPDRRLMGSLPVNWLCDVWACGLALADGRLVVGVTHAGYPDAEVLALSAPGADPVIVSSCPGS